MEERERPNSDLVREALREHDRRLAEEHPEEPRSDREERGSEDEQNREED
jgi:hypothetical protein